MAVDVVMPQMGESIFEGTVTKWLKHPGDRVERDEPLLEISTDKVDAEIPAPASGVLKEIKVQEGQTVQINTVIATLDADGAGAAQAPAATAPSTPAKAPEKKQEARPPAPQKPSPAKPAQTPLSAAPKPPSTPQPPMPEERLAPRHEEAGTPPAQRPQAQQPSASTRGELVPYPPAAQAGAREPAAHVRSSPLVRRLARENHVDLGQVSGSGEGGRVSKRDILSFIDSKKRQPAAATGAQPQPQPAVGQAVPAPSYAAGAVEVVPMTLMRKRIAEHMVLSKRTSPHVYTVFQVDLTKVSRLREQNKDEFEARAGTRLTFMSFFALAAIEAIKKFPIINSSVQEDSIVYKKDINLGIAVALDWGLIVPVIKHAEEKNFLGLQRAITDLAERARNKKLSPDEVQDGTFTITNPGIFGGLFGMPIINQPQVAILGVGGIHKTPVVIDDAIAIRAIVHLTLSFDHRVIDGAVADQFMAYLRDRLEGWEQPIV